MITIRPANINDAANINIMHVDTWRTAYKGIMPEKILADLSYEKREPLWHDILSETSDETVLVAETRERQIVGFVTGGKERGNYPLFKSELYGIYILKEWQRQGIGRRLVHELVKTLIERGFDTMLLWTLKEIPACAFYEQLGGEKIAEGIIEIEAIQFVKVAYGWKDLQALATLTAGHITNTNI